MAIYFVSLYVALPPRNDNRSESESCLDNLTSIALASARVYRLYSIHGVTINTSISVSGQLYHGANVGHGGTAATKSTIQLVHIKTSAGKPQGKQLNESETTNGHN